MLISIDQGISGESNINCSRYTFFTLRNRTFHGLNDRFFQAMLVLKEASVRPKRRICISAKGGTSIAGVLYCPIKQIVVSSLPLHLYLVNFHGA